MKSSHKKGWIASLSTAAAAALLLTAGGSAAFASPIVNIDPTATADLSVHKFEQSGALGEAGNGLELDPGPALTPMPNIGFTAKQVPGINLTTNQGWVDASNLTVSAAQTQTAGVTGVTETTDGTGLAFFEDLPLGLYLVTETSYPAGVTPADPFLVTLPLTHPTDKDSWLYDVHVYPKNSTTGIEKTVADAGSVALGDSVTWTINGDIPRVKELSGYRILDNLDAKLQYVAPARVSLTGGETLVAADYAVSFIEATNTVKVDLTATGLAKLATAWQADATAQVQVEIDTVVIASGEIANDAILFPNEGSFKWDPTDPNNPPVCEDGEPEGCTPPPCEPGETEDCLPGGPVTSEPVETKFGGITIKKASSKNEETLLNGATFMVFTTEAAARAYAADNTVGGFVEIQTTPAVVCPDPIVDPCTPADAVVQSEFVTASGLAVVNGLRYSGFANGVDVAEGEAGYQSYWLLETVAPDGYELLAEPIEFTVDAQVSEEITLPVKNVPKNAGFELPLTGGAGTTVLTVLGLLLVAGGVTAAMVSRRNKVQQH